MFISFTVTATKNCHSSIGFSNFHILTKIILQYLVLLWCNLHTVKVQQSQYRPEEAWGFPEAEAPDFKTVDTWRVRLSALLTVFLYPPPPPRKYSWHSIMEGLCQWKIPVTSSGTEPTNFQLSVQFLNQPHYCVPTIYLWWNHINHISVMK
jgi:hypothetical protein